MKIIERIFDATTGESVDIERDMTAQELVEYEAALVKAEFKAQEEAVANAKRQALLDRLGITEEEARLLLG